jgi:hypothetical protein
MLLSMQAGCTWVASMCMRRHRSASQTSGFRNVVEGMTSKSLIAANIGSLGAHPCWTLSRLLQWVSLIREC